MAKSQYLESVARNVHNTKTNTKEKAKTQKLQGYNSQLIYLEGNNINRVHLQSRRALKGVIQQYHHRFALSLDEK